MKRSGTVLLKIDLSALIEALWVGIALAALAFSSAVAGATFLSLRLQKSITGSHLKFG